MTATTQALAPTVKPRTVVLAAAFAIAAVLAALVSLSVGTTRLPLADVVEVLLGGGRSGTRLVVLELRMPRVATGLLVGIAFAVSGALLQTLSRNALASPDIVGVNSGASAAAVAVIVLAGTGGGNISGYAAKVGIPLAAVLGGLLATAVVAMLSIQRGVVDAGRVVLIGVGVAAAANSLVAWLLVIGDVTDAGRAAAWLAGSLNARTWSDAVPVGLAVLVLLPLALTFNRSLEALVLGDDVASSLGVRVSRVRIALLVVATVLAAMATAGAGPIAFVALVAPQIAQRLARSERPPLMTTAMLGALFVTLADLVARNGLEVLQVGPYELPVGVVTAACGAPYLIQLIGRQQKGR
ncbi:transport system permease protein [Kribbella flavida DSM 17836]|uniref:Transport system permease protein n=1 Tax=Kribbella flavida (strain DSM 17836 / JCM 10339 / NBRC 14399) TaxID=479435 RepID=D2Q4S6_KRIFD|nr:iron chelate uptake ABC transporter family permease subunit [Kribbella flavida]ADB34181.1 transport system permease protein [Kribbella flavida DSM 17836]